MVSAVNPYLNFKGNTREAFDFYRSVFGGDFAAVIRYADFPGNMGVAEADLEKLAHISLPLGQGNMLMGTDVVGQYGKAFTPGNNFYITLSPDDAKEAHRLFDALSAGGTVEMALDKTEWSELYGSLLDKFGVQWMIDYTGNVKFSFPQ